MLSICNLDTKCIVRILKERVTLTIIIIIIMLLRTAEWSVQELFTSLSLFLLFYSYIVLWRCDGYIVTVCLKVLSSVVAIFISSWVEVVLNVNFSYGKKEVVPPYIWKPQGARRWFKVNCECLQAQTWASACKLIALTLCIWSHHSVICK